MLKGYVRVSSKGQEHRMQLAAFKRAGVRVLASDRCGGDEASRPAFDALLAGMRRGDVLVVWKLDRVARSLYDLLSLMRVLSDKGASLRSLTEPIDNSTPIGELVTQIIGAVAQFELSLIRERVRAGKAAAAERGVVFGRRRLFDYQLALELQSAGHSAREIADHFGVGYNAVRSGLRRLRLGQVSPADPRRALGG